jgi:predicted esterase
MPYTLIHDGVMREFDFYAPPAWQYWLARAWADEGRIGLPVVVALHGAGQDPLDFQEKWFFPEVWNRDLQGNTLIELPGANPSLEELSAFLAALVNYQRVLANQFFVLYPYGMGWASTSNQPWAYNLSAPPAIPGSQAGTTFRPLYREDRPARGWNSGVDGVATGPKIDDVGFIKEMLKVIDERLRAELLTAKDDIDAVTAGNPFPWQYIFLPGPIAKTEAPETLFDVDRRFLFGYSNGGMMAHRLVNKMSDHWAALWGMSTAVGGQAQQGFGTPALNVPASGTYSTSFFAHHGEKDEIAPPGNVNGDVMAIADGVLQSPTLVAPVYLQYQLAGFGTPADRKRYMPGFLPLAQGWREYVSYNQLASATTRRARPGLAALGGKKTNGSAYSYSSGDFGIVPPTGLPAPEYPYLRNPIAVTYVDPDMGHTNFTSHANRYFFAEDVWKFFRYHPRVAL